MPSALRWSLRRKLCISSLCVLTPLVFFGYYVSHENIEGTKQQILSGSASTADIVAYQVDSFVESTEKLLRTLANTDVVRDQIGLESTLLFLEAASLHDDYKIIFATNKDGSIFANGITEGFLNDNVAGAPYRIKAMEQDMTIVSSRLPSQMGYQPVVNIIVPMKDSSGQIVGSVAAGVSLTSLQQRLASERLQARKAMVMVVDDSGKVLVHPDRHYVLEETSFASFPPVLAAKRNTGSGTIEYVDPNDGQHFLAAYATARIPNWTVVVAYPSELAYSPVKTAALQGLVGLVVCAVLALLAALFFTTKFTKPISELSKKTRAVMSSISECAPEPPASDEVRQLARAIDYMSCDLIRRTDELTRTRLEIEKRAREMRDLAARTLRVQEDERKRLALELHDGLAQFVSGALLQARFLKHHLHSDQELTARSLQAAEDFLSDAVAEVKRMMVELRPGTLEGGLIDALRRNLDSLQEVLGIHCRLTVVGEYRELPPDVEVIIYRIVQEALHNVRKHAEATKIEVTIRPEPQFLRIFIEDDGRGFDMEEVLANPSGRLGLLGMGERAKEIGATIEIESRPGEGTVVFLKLLVDRSERVPVLANA